MVLSAAIVVSMSVKVPPLLNTVPSSWVRSASSAALSSTMATQAPARLLVSSHGTKSALAETESPATTASCEGPAAEFHQLHWTSASLTVRRPGSR